MTKGIETGLAKVDAKFGKQLVELAQEKNRQGLQDTAINNVRELLDKIHKQREYLKQTQENIILLEKKVEAVQAGEFTFTPRGELVLNDGELNTAPVGIGECTNCGFNNKKNVPSRY